MSKQYLTAQEVSEIMGISSGHAYKVIKGLNEELKAAGYLVVAGKVPTAYFKKKYYGFETVGD